MEQHIKYKFVDIGTCFYATSIDEFGLNVNGILVEPIKKFLDVIPSSSTIHKENSAISDFNGENYINTYFSPEELEKCNLKYFDNNTRKKLRKRGVFGDFMRKFLNYSANSTLITPEKFLRKITTNTYKYKINCITFERLVKKYNIKHIEFLRIDTEGNDYNILNQIFEFLKDDKIKIDVIEFERDHLDIFCCNKELDIITKKIMNLNYSKSISKKDKDIVLTKNK